VIALLIVGGAASAEPAVVPLLRDGELVCSGSVVAPHAVLTAAHCLRDSRPLTVDGHAVIARIAISTFEPTTLAHDLAIVVVDPPFQLAPLARGIATASEVTLVGFGAPLPNVQRTGTASALALESLHLVSSGPAFTCEGDSGGPALAGGAIVGVTSSGDCTTVSRHARVDVDAAFIESTIAMTAAGVAGAGARCYYDANCANGVACVAAVDEPSRAFCAPTCTKDCAGDLVCVDGLCRHPLPSPGAEGARCETASDCASNPCVASKDDDDAICARRCFSDLPGFECPTGTTCAPADDGGEACFVPQHGGCSAAPSPALFALLALLQLLRGRGKP
jgi:hypothetical protein